MNKNIVISLENIVTHKKRLDCADMDGETVMMDIDKGKYYGFNNVGSRIWELVEKPIKVDDVISALLKEFNIDNKICENSVITFLNRLYYEDLISIS